MQIWLVNSSASTCCGFPAPLFSAAAAPTLAALLHEEAIEDSINHVRVGARPHELLEQSLAPCPAASDAASDAARRGAAAALDLAPLLLLGTRKRVGGVRLLERGVGR